MLNSVTKTMQFFFLTMIKRVHVNYFFVFDQWSTVPNKSVKFCVAAKFWESEIYANSSSFLAVALPELLLYITN